MSDTGPRLLVALDYQNTEQCLNLVQQLNPADCRLKIGKELFTAVGPSIVESVQKLGFDVFLDLKFHDIPNTVAGAVSSAAGLGVWMTNVHALGGERMMVAAREALAAFQQKPLLIAVTVLTSMDASDLAGIGIQEQPEQVVTRLASLAKQSGMDGIVCSAVEAAQMKSIQGAEFLTITPGIRPASAAQGDQRRVVTPEQAMQNGSDYIVVGRPITQAENPAEACAAIAASIQGL
ncbi:orotidine-5'-phosphate decarboxylase [Teredinibacter haidensis]|uniref:orotidine-5'-phosphate decarboxylase n=1 Tax=Teredinibacter haidensis TaxID=2731755 RepID=UPI000948BD65|nr:orotidine-5'-phosphate decarboxylase [Teredinibacter haidensis]